MQFVYPLFLWALAAISIPIIIHLFHFRRYKKIVFSDIRFLQQLQEQNKSKQKLKDLLVLLCRILAVSALVLAFAQPFIPLGQNSKIGGSNVVSVFVDNSFSMNAQGSDGALFEMAKNKARAIVNAYDNHDKFQVLTNNLSGSEQRVVNKTEALARIDNIEPTAASANLLDVWAKQNTAFLSEGNGYFHTYIISDFQYTQFKLNGLKPDSVIHYNFIPVENKLAQNVSIDSVYINTPFVKANEPVALQIKLTNHGQTAVEGLVVKVTLNKVQKALLNVNLAAGESVVAEAAVTQTGDTWQEGEVNITDYPVTFDDKLFFALKPTTQHHILHIGKVTNKFINAVYANDANYLLTQNSFGNINYQDFNKYNLIIVDEPTEWSSGLSNELSNYLDQGGQVLIIPSSENGTVMNSFVTTIGLPAYGNIINQSLKVTSVNNQHVLFKDVFKQRSGNTDYPVVSMHYPLQKQSNTRGKAVVTLNNGNDLLWQTAVKKGNVYQLALPLIDAYSNLQQHSLFVPMMLNMALGTQKNKPIYYVIKQNKQAFLPTDKTVTQKLIVVKSAQQELITEATLYQGQKVIQTEAINSPGWFKVTEKGSSNVLAVLAFNDNRTESSMKFLSEDDIKAQTESFNKVAVNTADAQVLGAQISSELSGKQLWRWFIMIALLFLFTEIALLRIMR
jgi:hypothetical protein